jgi:hypothetical protein
MSAQVVNIPLLRKAVEWAEAEAAKPEAQCEWWQGEFQVPAMALGRDCDTCYCIAGWVLHTAANKPDIEFSHADAAGNLLGIDGYRHLEDADHGLFHPANSIEDVRRIAEEIAASAGERL